MSTTTVNASNWMAGLEGTTPLHKLSIPGTHESCALYGSGPTQCQWFWITDQLRRGIRFLDLRCAHAKGSQGTKEFPIYHAGIYQYTNFQAVQDECKAFLDAHPTETILVNIQHENVPNLINRSGDEFLDMFVTLYDPAYWTFPSTIPNLDSCRKKMVLVRAYNANPSGYSGWPKSTASHALPQGGGLEWNGFTIDGTSYNQEFETQNGWEKWSNDADKIAAVKAHMQEAYNEVNGADRIYLNFLSRAAGAYVGTAAQSINNQILSYLKTHLTGAGKRLGVLPMDFTGNTGWNDGLEEAIIRRNTFKAGYSFKFAVTPFKIWLSVPLHPEQGWWMAEGEHSWSILGKTGTPGHPSVDKPMVFELYTHKGNDYFKVSGAEQYLSVSTGGQVGLYGWNDATVFTLRGSDLVSEYMSLPMGTKNNGEVWCSSDASNLSATLVPA